MRYAMNDLKKRLFDKGYLFGFFRATWLLERWTRRSAPKTPEPGALFHEDQPIAYDDERIRFRPSSSVGFPLSDVAEIKKLTDNQGQETARMTARFMGLYGVDSPMPSYYNDHLAREYDEDDPSPLRAFLDLFNHRLYAFFYRAWKKYRPALNYKPGGQDRHSRWLLSLAGLGTPRALEASRVPPMRLVAFASQLSGRVRSAQGLRVLLEDMMPGVPVTIVENVPRWVTLPQRPPLGSGHHAPLGRPTRLGVNTIVGEKMYDLAGKFRIRLGPMNLETYKDYQPGQEKAQTLRWLVRLYMPDHLDYDVELLLREEEAPGVCLGAVEDRPAWGDKLGQVAVLGRPAGPVITQLFTYEQT